MTAVDQIRAPFSVQRAGAEIALSLQRGADQVGDGRIVLHHQNVKHSPGLLCPSFVELILPQSCVRVVTFFL